jgi:hypothetical protein
LEEVMRAPGGLRTTVVLYAVCAVLAGGLQAFAQNPRLQFGNLDRLASKSAETVDVTLDGPLLKMAAKFLAGSKDPEEASIRDMVEKLKGIYVKSFEFDKKGEYTSEDVEAIRSQLRAPGWSRIVGVASRRGGENAEVFVMTDGDAGNILGLAILSAEPEELVVVNIVGPIDLEKLSALEGKMGVPKLNLEKAKPATKPEARKQDEQ